MYKPDFKRLDELTEEGFLRKVISPCEKLVLYNYTDKCTYEKKWNKHTLNARGTVYERSTGKLVAKAFPKFFNFSELPVSKARNLAKETNFKAFEKMDGSLGILYHYDGRWRINTRGSFTSDQAIYARKLLNKYTLPEGYESMTFLVEIIYPENKIIVDYGDKEELVLLGGYELLTGEEVFRDPENKEFEMFTERTGMSHAKPFKHCSIEDLQRLQGMIGKNDEGWVVRFPNGERAKFKGHDYLKIARILSKCSPLELWRNMSYGKVDSSLIAQIPEEILPEIEPMINSLEVAYRKHHRAIDVEHTHLLNKIRGSENLRKAIAGELNNLKYGSLHFSYLDNNAKRCVHGIMQLIKPKGNKLCEF